MAAQGTLGRKIIFKWRGIKVPGVREKTLTCNGEPVDVGDDDSSGSRELLDEPGQKSWDIGISGVTKSDVLRQVMFSDNRVGDVTLEYPNGALLAGDFFLTYNETGPYNEAQTFEGSLQSAGNVTYKPAP